MHKFAKTTPNVAVAYASICACVALALAGFTAFGADVYWVNPGSGDWNAASNWSTGTTPNINDHVFVTNANAITISTTTYGMKFGYVTITNGTATFSVSGSSGGIYCSNYNSTGTNTIEVAEGATLVAASFFRGYSDTAICKTGKGTLKCTAYIGNSSNKPKAVVVREGMLLCVYNHTALVTPSLVVEDGATLKFQSYSDQVSHSTVLELQEGSTLDLNSLSMTVRAIVGSGTIVNNSKGITLTLTAGPYRFDGTLPSGTVALAPNYAAGTTEWILGGDALKNGATLTSTNSVGVAAMVKFVDGCGMVPVPIGQIPEAAFTHEDGTPVQFAHYIASGKTYNHTAAGDDHWTNPVFGGGTINEKSAGTWTIDSLSLTGGTFNVDATATGSSIVFGGGECTNMTFTFGKTGGYEYRFEGVSMPLVANHVATGRQFVQTDGYMRFLPISAGSSSSENTNEVFYYISGGTLVSRPDSYYSMGLGLEASGDAHVILENGSYGAHSITYNRNAINHALRVKGNALVEAEGLLMYYYKGTTCTATVEVADNGVLSISGTIGSADVSHKSVSSFYGQVLFDGGTIRSASNGSVTWPTDAMVDKDFDAKVFARGMTVDVPGDYYTRTLTWKTPISSGMESGTDGGLKKTGDGTLYVSGNYSLSGPITVQCGQFKLDTMTCGMGAVTLDSGALTLRNAANTSVSLASNAATRIAYAGNACLRLFNKDAVVEIGSTEVLGATFARQGRGFLAIAPGQWPVTNDGLDGLGARVFKVLGDNGTLLSSNGTIAQPVFAMAYESLADAWGHNRGGKEVRLLTLDAETGCLAIAAPVATNSIPANADETTHVMFRDSTPCNIAASAHVGALEVFGDSLKISAGAVLTIGGGAGTTAHMTLNNRYLISGPAYARGKVTGAGALDFGAAEGIIAVNHTYGYDGDTAETRHFAEISAEIRGTGGVSFYSPFNPDDMNSSTRIRAVALSGANTYSGGTLMDNMIVLPRTAAAFGGGTVEVAAHGPIGAQLVFDSEYAGDSFANALIVAGRGFCYSQSPSASATNKWWLGSAVTAVKSVSLAGGVTLKGDTTMRVVEGATLTLGSAVTGTGRLTVEGAGTLSIAAAIACDGGVDFNDVGAVELRPGEAGTLPFAAGEIPNGATLVAEAGGVLVVDGDLDLSSLNFRVEGRRNFRGRDFTVLRATGTLTGVFASADLPGDNWSLEYLDDKVVLHRDVKGMTITIR